MSVITDEMMEAAARAIFEHSTYCQHVGTDTYLPDGPAWDFARAALEAVAPMIAAAERRACESIARDHVPRLGDCGAGGESHSEEFRRGCHAMADWIADAISARGEG